MKENLKKQKSRLGPFLVFMLSFMMAWTMIPGLFLANAAYAEAGDTPAHAKLLADNHDGTYKLALTVTGQAEKKPSRNNVIVILDISGSMNDDTGNTEETYTETTYNGDGQYGLVNGNYVPLYRMRGAYAPYSGTPSAGGTYYGWYNHRFVQLTYYGGTWYRGYNAPYSGTFYTRTDNNNNRYYLEDGTRYTGTRYNRQTADQSRLQAAQDAVNSLAETLLGYNGKDENPDDTFEMALVTFSNRAHIVQEPTTSFSTFEGTVNDLSALGGTNWEDALDVAQDVNFNDDNPTYVIFVSDGNPTFRMTEGNYPNHNNDYNESYHNDYDVWGSGSETSTTTVTRCYDHAKDDAAALATKVGKDHFYTIGIYGNVDRMESLTTDAGAPESNYFSAENTAALQDAFAAILEKIEMAGFADVEVADPTTQNVAVSGGTVDLLEIDRTSFKYYRSGGTDSDGNVKYDPTKTSITPVGGTTQYIGEEWSTEGEGGAPAATVSDTGVVDWDLSSVGVLENGVTYTVTFDVYPSQETYDYIADLKNGKIQYSDLPAEVRRYLVKDGNDYSLRTNKNTDGEHPTLSWDDTRDEAGTQTSAYVNPEPVATEAEQMDVEKIWKGAYDDEEKGEVRMKLLRNGTDSGNDFVLNQDNDYKASKFIATGLLRKTGTNTIQVLDEGHDYVLAEPVPISYHWDLDADTLHPMIIDGTLTMLRKADNQSVLTEDNTFNGNFYRFGGIVYEVKSGTNALTATNVRRANLNIKKEVLGSVDPDSEFEFKLKVNNPKAPANAPAEDTNDESDYWLWFSVYDTINNRTVFGEDLNVNATGLRGPNEKGYYHLPNGNEITIKLKHGWNLRFTNIPTGTTYEFVETPTEMPTGVTFSDVTFDKAGTDSTMTKDAAAQKASGSVIVDPEKSQQGDEAIQVTFKNNDNRAKVTPQLTKAVTGADATEQFSFSLAAADDTTRTAIRNKDIVMPDTLTKSTVTEGNIKKDGSEQVSFDDIIFYKEGAYKFTLDETTTTTAAGWTYDAATHDITVRITKGTDGKLSADVTGNGPTFTNKYETVTATPQVKKTVTGHASTEAFNFSIALKSGTAANVVMPESTTVSTSASIAAGASETKSFEEITFLAEGTYVFNITETNTDPAAGSGWTYDNDAPKTVTVTVGRDTDGNLKADVSEAPEFTNSYEAAPVSAQIPVKKNVVPKGSSTTDITGKFTFTLTPVDGAPMPEGKDSLTVKSGVDGATVKFDEIEYEEAGTYTYKITETITSGAADVNGIKLETDAEKTVTITIEDDGKGKLKIVTNNGAEFNNPYSAKSLDIKIPVTKILELNGLTGPSDITGKFKFTLAADNNSNEEGVVSPMPQTPVITNPAPNGGTAEFGDEAVTGKITVNKPGVYHYTVTESLAGDRVPGVTIDSASKAITVTVVDNHDGTMSYTVEGAGKEITNTYNVEPTSISIPVKKVVTGENAPTITDDYTFTLSGNGTTRTVKSNGSGNVVWFDSISYSEPGTYTYTVTESGTVEGVINDTAEHSVTVTVSDTGNGTLSAIATSTEDSPVTFTNTYHEAAISIPVEKQLSVLNGQGPESIKEKFEFTITGSNGAPMPAVKSYKNNADNGGNMTFGPITFKSEGTFTYTVTETNVGDAVPGVTNDKTSSKSVTVKVTRDEETGELTATFDGDSSITFINTYDVEPTDASFPVKKILDVPDNVEGPDTIAGKYTFILEAENGAPLKDKNGNTITTSKTNPDKDGGTVTFGEIRYTEPGIYKYKVTESGSVDGVTNDGSASTGKEITVTVVDNRDGTMTATASSTDKDPLTFTNTYTYQGTEAILQVHKTIQIPSGLTGPKDMTGKFEFKLTGKDGAPMPATGGETVTNPDADGGTASFGSITFSEPGEYEYEITETAGNLSYITYDKSTQTATVSIVDGKNGSLRVDSIVYSNGEGHATFTNPYKVDPVEKQVPVKKILTVPEGMTGPKSISGEFTFTIAVAEGSPEGTPLPSDNGGNNTVTCGENGVAVLFDSIKFTAPGTYTYVLTESGEMDGVIPDSAATTGKTVTVTVVDNQEGKLVATVTPSGDNTVAFNNTYNVEPITASIPVEKILEVPEGLQAPGITEAYTFTLAAENGAPITGTDGTSITTVLKNPDSDGGDMSFGAIQFTKPGTYTYTVTESGSAPGVNNDPTATKSVSVVVTDKGNGTMEATVNGGKKLQFKNTYDVQPITASIPVEKILETAKTNLTPDSIADKFTFTLEAVDNAPMKDADGKTITTTYNNPSATGGTVSFGAIKFTEPGTFKYKITESGSAPGVTNDTTATKEVTVVVADQHDGTLVATVNGGKTLQFKNTYDVQPTTAQVPVKKILTVPEGMTGPESIARQFTFHINRSTETPSAPLPSTLTVVCDEKGVPVNFGAITYTAPGTYKYVLTETGSMPGVTNDTELTKNVTVNVVDNGNGTMTATVDPSGDNTVAFNNTYGVDPTTAVIPVEKILEVPEGLKDPDITGKFTFTLAAGENTATGDIDTPMPETTSYTNPGKTGGTVTFGSTDDPITYTAPGTYTYTVTESGSAPGVTNDKTATKTVTVDVTDNGNGTLSASVNGGKKLQFKNTYDVQPTDVEIPVKKLIAPANVAGLDIKDKFTFTLTGAEGAPMPTTTTLTNPAADGGVAKFTGFSFTRPGKFTYTITESGKVAGFTNDSAAATGKTVTVTVVDNANGTLTATATATAEKPLTFTNTYDAEGEIVLKGTKTLMYGDLADYTFSYEVYNTDENGKATGTAISTGTAVKSDDAASTDGDESTAEDAEGDSTDEEASAEAAESTNGTITFGSISYTLEDLKETAEDGTVSYVKSKDFTYIVKEVIGNDEEIIYDKSEKTVTVTVTNNGDGTLSAVVKDGSDDIAFTNYKCVRLLIEKDLKDFVDNGEQVSVSIVFHITATENGTTVLDTTRGMSYDKNTNNNQSIEIGMISPKAVINVDEVYSGNYEPDDKEQTASGLEKATDENGKTYYRYKVKFNNTMDRHIYEGGAVNHYSNDGESTTYTGEDGAIYKGQE